MDQALIDLVWQRAGSRCEYCRLHQNYSWLKFQIDHIKAKKHRGTTVAANLALSCYYCNSFKGTNIAGHDPDSGKMSGLYNPRRHKWDHHFRWDGPLLIGRTAIGRTTISVLNINEPDAMATRGALIQAGLFAG